MKVFDHATSPRRHRFFPSARDFSFLGSMPAGATLTRASTGTRVNASGVLVSESADVARFTYNGATGALEGLLVEPSRTNLIRRSEELSNATWTNSGTFVVADQAVAPDGATTADKYKDASNADPQVYQSLTVTDATTYCWSLYAKRDGASAQPLDVLLIPQGIAPLSTIHFGLTGAGTSTVIFGAVTAKGIDLVGASYYRAWASDITTSAGTGYYQVNLVDTDGTTISAPDADSGCFVWGAMIEVGSAPSSYIPTAGSAVTRAADVLTLAVPDGTYAIDIERLSGTTSLTGQAVSGGAYTVPTDVSPLRRVTMRRTA